MIGAIALALAVAGAPAPVPADDTGWLRVETSRVVTVQALWEQLLVQRARRYGAAMPGRNPEPPDLRFDPAYPRVVETEGELAGEWRFLAAEGAERPHAGYRLRWAGEDRYRWIADLYCEPGAGCEAARAALDAERAPPPPTPDHRPDWVAIVGTEACEPGPVHTPAPDYPSRALRAGASGRATLVLFVNRCGDVRQAWVVESTGDRTLDRAAVRAAERWKTAPVPDGQATGTYRVVLDFALPVDE
ncbi:MAG TPA: energy transducer TonB [Arenimonas sp.]|uniref:energy transducer TonB n=1 Tax=Arenimonas sp. TaxID=1872635 RepID=UPI002D8009AE|nr:energy transducer TonB [Arenimonas sp.]HEU0152888.1 energy transducer TonB [Arenimonas sp.]